MCTLAHSMTFQTYHTCNHSCQLCLSSFACLTHLEVKLPPLVCQALSCPTAIAPAMSCRWRQQMSWGMYMPTLVAGLKLCSPWHDALDCIMGPYQVNLPTSHSLAACPIVAAVHDTDCTSYLLHVHSITVDCCLHRPSAARRIACCAAT